MGELLYFGGDIAERRITCGLVRDRLEAFVELRPNGQICVTFPDALRDEVIISVRRTFGMPMDLRRSSEQEA